MDELRQKFVDSVKARRGCDDAEAEVIMQRIAARLDGHTHAEAVAMFPLPAVEA